MRELALNEIEMISGAKDQLVYDTYLGAIGFWGTFTAVMGGIMVPLLEMSNPTLTLATKVFVGIGLGYTTGAGFAVIFHDFITHFAPEPQSP